MHNLKIILFSIIVGFLSSCVSKKVPYTSDIQHTYGFSEDKLQQVQFYTSQDIVLYTTKSDGSNRIENGKIILGDSKEMNELLIKKETPCILKSKIDNNTFEIEFANGLLCFKSIGDVYYLSSPKWSNTEGLIRFAGRNYFTRDGKAFLLVEIKNLNKIKRHRHVVHGIFVEN